MKRFIVVILTLFFVFINMSASFAVNYAKKDLSVVTKDGFNIKATLTYPKISNKKFFKTVVLLHSHGTNSTWWGNLPGEFLNNGYAVVTVDLRGHGASVYNSKLQKVSWKSLTNNAYKKYPDDVMSVISYIKDEYPKIHFFDDWAIVGSDIGGSSGVIAADKLKITKPKTIVLLSPVVQTRGLYIPVNVAQLNGVDFLAIPCESDSAAKEAAHYLKKFAQNEFVIHTSTSRASGMIMLKNDPEIIPFTVEWINTYFKD